jgi:hypothetical protein
VQLKTGCLLHIEGYDGFKVLAANISDVNCLYFRLENYQKIVELKSEVNLKEVNSVDISVPSGASQAKIKGFKISQFVEKLSLATKRHNLQGKKSVRLCTILQYISNS